MDPIVIILLILVILALFSGSLYGPGYAPYANTGYGLGGILVIVLIVVLLMKVF